MQLHLDARKLLRIEKMCHFLLLENESIAGYLVLTIVQVSTEGMFCFNAIRSVK